MHLKHNDHLWGLANAVEANKCRHNESKFVRTKKESCHANVEGKLKEISKWDSFHAALVEIEEGTAVEELLDSDDEDELMDSGNIAEAYFSRKDDSSGGDSDSDDDVIGYPRVYAARA